VETPNCKTNHAAIPGLPTIRGSYPIFSILFHQSNSADREPLDEKDIDKKLEEWINRKVEAVLKERLKTPG